MNENPSVPARWQKEVERILISQTRIAHRVKELAQEVEDRYAGQEVVIVPLLNGTVVFLADLIRNLSIPLKLDFIGVSSYRAKTEAGELVYTKQPTLDVKDKHVLLVDDILDTGKTLSRVSADIKAKKPLSLSSCVLLNKKERRTEKIEADFIGFEIPDLFVVGYGLDYAEQYRHLPFIGVLHPHIYKSLA